MKEILKLVHVYTGETDQDLRDFNLTAGSGEIIYIEAATDIEKNQICSLLTGITGDFRGNIYLHGKLQTGWNRQAADNAGIYFVDEKHQLVPEMTVFENICVMKQTAPSEVLIPFRKQMKEVRNLLELTGLQKKPGEKIGRFSHFEKQLVCIARMLYRGVRLFILDGMENKCSMREIRHMKNLVKKLAAMEIGIIFLQRQPAELLQICTKCVILRDGSDAKILFKPDISGSIIADYRLVFSQIGVNHTTFQAKVGQEMNTTCFQIQFENGVIKTCRTIGFFDLVIDSNIHFKEYLSKMTGRKIRVSVNGENLENLLEDRRKIPLIGSAGPDDELLANLDLGENLAFAFRYMEKGLRWYLSPRLCLYLRMEFLKKFNLDSEIRNLKEMSYFEKKLLAVYRWLQTGNFHAIVLEEPYLNLQGEEIEKMQEYFLDISSRQKPVGIFSKNVAELIKTCEVIILSYNKEYVKYYDKENFDSIIPETARMIER